MLLLDYHNPLLKTILKERFVKPAAIDQIISDFDGVTYHIFTPEVKTKILISISIKCYQDLLQHGAEEVLKREYGSYITETEQGYNFSILIDLTALPEDPEERNDLITRVSLLRRHTMAAPFEKAISIQQSLSAEAATDPSVTTKTSEVMTIRYRDEEAIYVQASYDRVTVIFSIVFREETDRVLAKTFMQEFVDARKQIQMAPHVMYRSDPPLEIRGLPGVPEAGVAVKKGDIVYITFVFFPMHIENKAKREHAIEHIQTFRDYFHYHIKAAKAYIHSRMRHRVAHNLKVLNRAKPENEMEEKEKKTASGRTFKQT
ncbi:Arp2/3 complex, 34 kd subunit p34-Arc-domain-containing protein [Pyronema domesticum]|uniref:Arp2/3 complex 34 kDa subunit n=1 Tax=Pyronema omphalodes (strain CBS 100304) TaxID=1076935 RepID=U4LP82_PYROM|nr:Arp2/3 complex, 34 kd subunit p34-Arc-domain-containing protein [Pyronema domesticum]CCX33961.1 Similar to Actin-related protein 2/3 complex subunit 2; acc. no. O14241 [Pyronema omphalodes CBS 100304]